MHKSLMYVPSARWLSPRQLAVKYSMSDKAARKWVAGQGKDSYRLQVIKTATSKRILDPQLAFPPHRTAPPDKMFIFHASEVAMLLGVTRRAVNLMAELGQVRFTIYGSRKFFPLSEVRRLISTRGCARRGLKHNTTVGMVIWGQERLQREGHAS